MKPPPKKEAALRQAAPNQIYDKQSVARRLSQDNLFHTPEFVSKLERAGVGIVYRPSSGDLITRCPYCSAKLALDATKPFWLCLGRGACEAGASTTTFDQVVSAIIGRVRP